MNILDKSLNALFKTKTDSSKRYPYCMKKKRSVKKCQLCGVPSEKLIHKTMPGLIKGKCHKDYVLNRRCGHIEITKLARERINLDRELRHV